MAIEVACSQCQGRLMVEQPGVVVACPHCGAHLTVENPSAGEDATTQTDETTDDSAAPSTPEASENSAAETVPAVPAAAPEIAGIESVVAPPAAAPTGAEHPDSVVAPAEATVPAIDSAPDLNVSPEPSATSESSPASSAPESTADTSPLSSIPTPSVSAPRGVSRQTFTLVRNYAIAVTIAVIILIFKLLNPNMSALESLPDVKPPKKDDKIVYKLVPEAAEMPPGHLLTLGQSQRYGNLKVTPLRVTREPVEFVHHLGETGVSREPGPDIVKLWFEFENLSNDQHIAPLDELVFRRDDNDFENVRSNNFVCRKSQKKKGGELVFVYDLNEFDIWNLKDQHVEQEIAPGEKLETYIPTTEEGVAQLLNSDEPLVWRVHFRKGYSPRKYGVTTVIEVAFESSDIQTSVSNPAPTAKEAA